MKHYQLFRTPDLSRFGIRARNLEIHASVYVFNAMVLIGSSFALMLALYWILKRQLRRRVADRS